MPDLIQKAILEQARDLAVAKALLPFTSPAERLPIIEKLRNNLRQVDQLLGIVDPSGELRKAAKAPAKVDKRPAFMRKM